MLLSVLSKELNLLKYPQRGLCKVMTKAYPIIAFQRIGPLKIIKSMAGRLRWPIAILMWPLLALTVRQQPVFQDTTSNSRPAQPGAGPNQLRTVVIDPGHGGKDPGCMTRRNRESRIVLKIGLQLARKIKSEMPNVRVILTRASDEFIDLAERAAIANRNRADLFISIHVNANPHSSKLNGTETYTLGLHKTEGNLEVARRENSVILKEDNYQQKYKGFDPNSPLAHIMLANYQHAFIGSSINFAEKVERSFRKTSDRVSRGVKQAGFVVLWRTTMPSVLVETGFLTNPTEEKYLASEEGQEEIAHSIFKAFEKYKEEIETVE